MLTETGRVVAVEEESLWVETIRQTTCGSCSAQKGCGHGLLNQLGNGRHSYLRVLLGGLPASRYAVDDTVRIAIPEQVIVRSSVVVYLLPIVLTLVVAALAVEVFSGRPVDLVAISGAVLGFLLGVLLVRWYSWRHRDDVELQPQLLGGPEVTLITEPDQSG